MDRREFLQLAKPFNPTKHKIGGWFLSEKLDGTRCLWDGGVSRGMATETIPWASIYDPKTKAKKKKIKPVATGLWSRYGNPIIAPDWFLDKLPPFACDGELWAGRGNFQLCRSICAGDSPDKRFDKIQFAVYSAPPLTQLFQTGEIKNANFIRNITFEEVEKWFKKHVPQVTTTAELATFENELFALRAWNGWDDQVFIHQQILLPMDDDEAASEVVRHLDKLIDRGAEGVIIRDGQAQWQPRRVGSILKFKPWLDDEGVVVGFTAGRETDKGSKHLGKIGALILDYKGKRLELAGLTDEEREFEREWMFNYAKKHPGEDMPYDQLRGEVAGKHFKLGQTITFKYRKVSDDGVPIEARYWRHRDVE